MREIERQVMLQIIDQRWREHLYEMDYLQEGINLRAMGQKDPLVEWQREGFEMFGAMMQAIAQDFVKYVMHAQVAVAEQTPSRARAAQRAVLRAQRPVRGGRATWPPRPGPRPRSRAAEAPARPASRPTSRWSTRPVVKSEWDKTRRNEPCPCGSGKKFKLCHGA